MNLPLCQIFSVFGKGMLDSVCRAIFACGGQCVRLLVKVAPHLQVKEGAVGCQSYQCGCASCAPIPYCLRFVKRMRAINETVARRGRANVQRPLACSPRSTIHVELARATNSPLEFVTSHSTIPTVRPRFTTLPTARSLSFHTGRRKLIFSSSVVNDSSSSSVDANATPIAASATSHRSPPCSVPIGLVCLSSA